MIEVGTQSPLMIVYLCFFIMVMALLLITISEGLKIMKRLFKKLTEKQIENLPIYGAITVIVICYIVFMVGR